MLSAMATHLVFWIAFFVLSCNDIGLVQAYTFCETNADCKYFSSRNFCCGDSLSSGSKERRCSNSCLNRYCSNDSDCSNTSMCCRSNMCVERGCLGCTGHLDCDSQHQCCKRTFPFNETVCGANCINETCNSSKDCGYQNECCRSGKCGKEGCDVCFSNSDCALGQYCCREAKREWFPSWKRRRDIGCRDTCVGETCNSDDDCGGPGECCISNECATSGCSGCSKYSDCPNHNYCCKKTFSSNESFCAANCINATCNWNNDCGGECCRSGKCVKLNTDCEDKCTSDSECNLGRYCCTDHWFSNNTCRPRCVGKSCNSDDECERPNECCRSEKCVSSGCSGCTKNTDCPLHNYCCKKESYFLNETFCAPNCINEYCFADGDCGGLLEKCITNRCHKFYGHINNQCSSDSECNSDQYCEKIDWDLWMNGCSYNYGRQPCRRDFECEGEDECCISNECVRYGCSGCTTDSDCSYDHYCCKNRSSCGKSCVGAPCLSHDDCGGRKECCISNQCTKSAAGCYSCTSQKNCSIGQYCCKKSIHDYVRECSPGCIGKPCTSKSDCGGENEECDLKKCTIAFQFPWRYLVIPIGTALGISLFCVVLIYLCWK